MAGSRRQQHPLPRRVRPVSRAGSGPGSELGRGNLLLCRFWSQPGLEDLVGYLSDAGRGGVCHTPAWASSLRSPQTPLSCSLPELWLLSRRAQPCVSSWPCAGMNLRRCRAAQRRCLDPRQCYSNQGTTTASQEGTQLPGAPAMGSLAFKLQSVPMGCVGC